ncbi:MAG TPA: elongation factor P [Candidatus Ratteibacteria bacterium]|nr:elongation factor P [Candidatus Ratteibacteria bacterium]
MKVIDLREGSLFKYEGNIYSVLSYSHLTQSRGRGKVFIKVRDMKTNKTVELTFRSDFEVGDVFVDEIPLTYLYREGNVFYFMDSNTYEQFPVAKEIVGEKEKFLIENLQTYGAFLDGEIIDIILPTTVDLKVIEAEPGYKGDTVQGGRKKVKVETGLIVQTPLFIEIGDTIKVDTRTGEYITRV